MAGRKGVDLLERAVTRSPPGLRIVIAGTVYTNFEEQLDQHVRAMRDSGADVHVRGRTQSESEGLAMLAGGLCAVLPYPRHYGMSRVLLEAAAVGTPVVAHEFGLIGHFVRDHGLGAAVDCRDPAAFADAIQRFTTDDGAPAHFARRLDAFAKKFSFSVFQHALRQTFGLPAGRPPHVSPPGRGRVLKVRSSQSG